MDKLNKAVTAAGFHEQRPLGKGGQSAIADTLNSATRVSVPAHRAVKVGAYGNRGRTLGLRAQKDRP